MSKRDVIKNTRNAFECIEKLYLECMYLIMEVEGLLSLEPEEFIIGKPRGYQVTALRSTGLGQKYVSNWLIKKMAVFFAPKVDVKTGSRSQTITKFVSGKKVLYFRFLLDDSKKGEPELWSGVLYDFLDKFKPEKPRKLEEMMSSFETYENTYFASFPDIVYEDNWFKFKAKLLSNPLFDIKNSDDIKKKIVAPALALFREVEN